MIDKYLIFNENIGKLANNLFFNIFGQFQVLLTSELFYPLSLSLKQTIPSIETYFNLIL